jgi:hypothetical protein
VACFTDELSRDAWRTQPFGQIRFGQQMRVIQMRRDIGPF